MPVFFTNAGSTCFANCGLQLLLSNPAFCQYIGYISASAASGVIDIASYRTWAMKKKEAREDIFDCPPELKPARRLGLAVYLQRVIDISRQHSVTSQDAAVTTFVEASKYLPLLTKSIRTLEQQDLLEFIDEVLDVLSIPFTQRPSPSKMHEGEETSAALLRLRLLIENHCGGLSSLWGIVQEVSTCMSCSKVVRRELCPFLWIDRVRSARVASGVHCEHCHSRDTQRRTTSEVIDTADSIIVQVARHNDDGTKSHQSSSFSPHVRVAGSTTYSLQTVVYHSGPSFQGGHYVCAIKRGATWVLNSDQDARYPPSDTFEIQSHRVEETYAALYLRE